MLFDQTKYKYVNHVKRESESGRNHPNIRKGISGQSENKHGTNRDLVKINFCLVAFGLKTDAVVAFLILSNFIVGKAKRMHREVTEGKKGKDGKRWQTYLSFKILFY